MNGANVKPRQVAPIGLDTDPTAELAALLAEAERLDLDYLTILALRLDTAGFTF